MARVSQATELLILLLINFNVWFCVMTTQKKGAKITVRLTKIFGKEKGDFLYPGNRKDQEGDGKKIFKIRLLILNHLWVMFTLLWN